MCYLTATLMIPALLLTLNASAQPDIGSVDSPDNHIQYVSLQTHMFDGINLTEIQRRQMRDLMQQMRQDFAIVNLNDIENMHQLVIARYFDENAVHSLAENIARHQIKVQVKMAKVCNQMYQILTPDQKQILNKNYQLRIEKLRLNTDNQ